MQACLILSFALAPLASAAERDGIAARYPGDEGIERDPRVLFVEDFETGTVEEIAERWGHISHRENSDLVDEIHASSPGARSIRIAKNGHLFTHTRGVDAMYARFYVRFHPKTGYIHHFVHLVADRTPEPWPKGGAGETPPGDAKFSTGIEPTGAWGKYPPPGVWNFYTYWHEMETKWGSVFYGKEEPIEPGRWYCVEAMMEANSHPEEADGQQAFWVDGVPQGRFPGFRWRTSENLKINSFWLLFYNTEQPARHNDDPDPEGRVMEVWFDDIVIATEYIGPISGKPRDGKKKAAPSRSALLTPGLLIAPPGKRAFAQDFEEGAGSFTGGAIAEGGARDGQGADAKGGAEGGPEGDAKGAGGRAGASKAYAFPPAGASIWRAYSVPVKESTTVRFKLKALGDAREATVLIWSKKNGDNCRFRIGGIPKGEWREISFRAIEARVGWDMRGPSLEGDVIDNFKIVFEGGAEDRVLIDDFEILE